MTSTGVVFLLASPRFHKDNIIAGAMQHSKHKKHKQKKKERELLCFFPDCLGTPSCVCFPFSSEGGATARWSFGVCVVAQRTCRAVVFGSAFLLVTPSS